MSLTEIKHSTDVDHDDYTEEDLDDVDVKKGRRCKATITIAVIASLCLNIGLVLMLVLRQQKHSLSIYRQTQTSLQLEHGWISDSVCVECSLLGLSREQAMSRRDIRLLSLRDAQLCCLPEAESLWRLVNLIIVQSKMKIVKNKKTSVTSQLPSAHLYLNSLEDDYKWSEEYGFGAAHVTGPVHFWEGKFVIEKPGLYNIYSFITLKRETDSSTPTTISHSIWRINSNRQPSTDVILQTGVQLPRHSETFTTSYLSGLVHLQTQDELYVDVSHRELVYRYAPSNFFGLHLVQ